MMVTPPLSPSHPFPFNLLRSPPLSPSSPSSHLPPLSPPPPSHLTRPLTFSSSTSSFLPPLFMSDHLLPCLPLLAHECLPQALVTGDHLYETTHPTTHPTSYISSHFLLHCNPTLFHNSLPYPLLHKISKVAGTPSQSPLTIYIYWNTHFSFCLFFLLLSFSLSRSHTHKHTPSHTNTPPHPPHPLTH